MRLRLCLLPFALALAACGTTRLTGDPSPDTGPQLQSLFGPSDSIPIFLIDGVEVSFEIARKTDPATIDSVVVLKERSGRAEFGHRGRHGVILIYLKPARATPLANDAWWLTAGRR